MSVEDYKRDYQAFADKFLSARAEDFDDWRDFEEEFYEFLNRNTLLTPARYGVTEEQANTIDQEVRSKTIEKFMEG